MQLYDTFQERLQYKIILWRKINTWLDFFCRKVFILVHDHHMSSLMVSSELMSFNVT